MVVLLASVIKPISTCSMQIGRMPQSLKALHANSQRRMPFKILPCFLLVSPDTPLHHSSSARKERLARTKRTEQTNNAVAQRVTYSFSSWPLGSPMIQLPLRTDIMLVDNNLEGFIRYLDGLVTVPLLLTVYLNQAQ